MTGLRNFDDLIQECIGCDKNLLLGNGFSIAHDNAFKYSSLLEKSKLPNEIKDIFYKNVDYEQTIERLNYFSKVFKAINEDVIANKFNELTEKIKFNLVETLTEIQANVKIYDNQNRNTFLFLSNFNNIFTLNYDLLLYWVIIYSVRLYQNSNNDYKNLVNYNNFYPRDGFDRNEDGDDCIWCLDRWEQNIYYLHGGLHLFYDTKNTYKLTYNANNNQTIIDKTKYWLERGTSPLVITEGNSDDKLKWITGNNYLNYCYEQLYQIQGVLFIHGHSLDNKDKHIFDAINANTNINAVYISIFDPVTNEATIRQKASELFPERIDNQSLAVDFYNAQSVALW